MCGCTLQYNACEFVEIQYTMQMLCVMCCLGKHFAEKAVCIAEKLLLNAQYFTFGLILFYVDEHSAFQMVIV